MIIKQEDISGKNLQIGNKTKNLKKLTDHGFLVPDFVAIPSEIVKMVDNDTQKLKELCKEIQAVFPKNSYAVRSSALIEDQSRDSFAGQFSTELNVAPASLEMAIKKVIEQSKDILHDDPDKFSLIIQEYLDAECSGVCFTRNPNGRREMVIEYHSGAGENIVGGKITPMRDIFHWNEDQKASLYDAAVFKAIEDKFGFPQDIEWCRKGVKQFLLQTRPITTINQNKYEEMLYLDKILSQENDFYFEKTGISEISPRPTPFTFSLIKKMYGNGGSIMNVYQKHHICFAPKRFLKIVGNELYVNRNLEVKTLLPSFDLLNKNYRLTFSSIRYLLRTIRNIFFTTLFREDKNLTKKLSLSLSNSDTTNDFSALLQRFFDDYETIFEINTLAAKFLKKLETLVKKEKLNIPDLLTAKIELFDAEKSEALPHFSPEGFKGNTLEVADEGKFYSLISTKNKNKSIKIWWQNLPQWKKNLFKKPIVKAITYQKYCEYARILMVKNLSGLRNCLLSQSPYKQKRDIYFHTLDEIINKQWDEKLCLERKKEYEKFNRFDLPAQLTGRLISDKSLTMGISPGIAKGYVIGEDAMADLIEPKILYTQMLSPNLTKHFPKIKGIISEKGGFLSHLAIIARERNLPIVVIGDAKNIRLGQYVEMNGSSGTIEEVI